MHELSIAHDMLELITDRLGGKKDLKTVTVTVGPLSGISPEALHFCFTESAGQQGFGTPELKIQIIKAKARCGNCGALYQLKDFYSACPECDSFDREVLSGDRFTLDTVEINRDSPGPDTQV
ncbi:hydrogenase maturation nickel metallochaperone HypA [Fibrobacterota bacterium]